MLTRAYVLENYKLDDEGKIAGYTGVVQGTYMDPMGEKYFKDARGNRRCHNEFDGCPIWAPVLEDMARTGIAEFIGDGGCDSIWFWKVTGAFREEFPEIQESTVFISGVSELGPYPWHVLEHTEEEWELIAEEEHRLWEEAGF